MNDHNLLYCHLANPVFSDIMFFCEMSRRSNKSVHVYATDFGLVRVHPMVSRSKAQETFSLLFARDSVLPACTCKNAKGCMISSVRSSKMLHAS